ncbi:hypothetical protein NHX12_013180 [Muraenolepis orangiensis]|uniref:G-protein coupled receptors family 1 profile domain-containing protein n=1 Tax=Muraenolepis orangiensis TaxID=630683 RepID=A0A9Q0DHP0_9TELE|nr:hypothetical protein NHX12_013180 [Muraenolepis orangiensis]
MGAELLPNHSEPFVNGSPWYVNCDIVFDNDSRRIALFLLYLFIFMVGLIGNLLVVWINWRGRHSANGVQFCILNLSLSDLTVMASLPFFILEVTLGDVWLWGHFLCKFTNLLYLLNLYGSSFFLALMTLERYLSLVRPSTPSLFPVSGRRRWLLCGGVWLFSLFLTLLENVHVRLLEWDEPGCFMVPQSSSVEWYISMSFLQLILQFVVPGAVIVGCNVQIARAVRTAPDVQGRREVWLVHVYSLVFIICWLPFNVVMTLITVDDLHPMLFSCNTVEIIYFAYSVVQGLSLFHCVANPILYNFLSKSFRNKLLNTVVSCLPRENLPEAAGGEGTDHKKQRWQSSSSTSHSDVG